MLDGLWYCPAGKSLLGHSEAFLEHIGREAVATQEQGPKEGWSLMRTAVAVAGAARAGEGAWRRARRDITGGFFKSSRPSTSCMIGKATWRAPHTASQCDQTFRVSFHGSSGIGQGFAVRPDRKIPEQPSLVGVIAFFPGGQQPSVLGAGAVEVLTYPARRLATPSPRESGYC